MNRIDRDSLAEIEFQLRWQSRDGKHTDTSVKLVNFWRDWLPGPVFEELMGASGGERKTFRFPASQAAGEHSEKDRHRLKRSRFNEKMAVPRYGRFYPKGILRDFYNVFPQNVQPIRCVGADTEQVEVDCNHPMAGHDVAITAVVHDVMKKPFDRGGQSKVLMEQITEGPGMQARYNGRPTDFDHRGAFARSDESEDTRFYDKARMVTHIDARAIETISALYGSFLSPDMAVLDLMSSWRSHVPDTARPEKLVGLGMNAEEMAANPQLTEHVVHDLNAQPRLPFADGSFDCVICTVSVEYMIRPVAVFRDIARILKPGGRLVHTFSNRWFPPKAIRLWTELHEFERMGLVLDYFQQSGQFTDLASFSSCGWNRPESDKYYPDMPQSDPVFAVWGTRT